MKALLDILKEEKYLVDEINKFDRQIKHTHEYYSHVDANMPDCDAKEHDLKRMLNDIDIWENHKARLEQRLHNVHCELSSFIDRLIELSL